MRTLDRYIIRNFLVSLGLWFVVLMVLRVSIDLFINVDEFSEGQLPLLTRVQWTAEYYFHHSFVYLDEMGGLMVVVAAVFALALMNRSNELTAMLASGLSLYRVVWPIVLCALAVQGGLIANKELVIPRFARELSRSRDYLTNEKEDRPRVLLPQDNAATVWFSPEFRSTHQTLRQPTALIRNARLDLHAVVHGQQGQWQSLDGRTGWLIAPGRVEAAAPAGREGPGPWPHMLNTARVYTLVGPDRLSPDPAGRGAPGGGAPDAASTAAPVIGTDETYPMTVRAERLIPGGTDAPARLIRPRFTLRMAGADANSPPRTFAVIRAERARWVADAADSRWELTDGMIWVPSDMSPRDIMLRPSRNWLDYLSSRQLSELLNQRSLTNRRAVLLARHVQVTSPINHLIMLLLALPFILSRERNIKASAGLAVLVVGAQLATIYLCRYIAMPPVWSAWMPILLFGPAAALAFDSVKS